MISKNNINNQQHNINDGGYYAIKGFAFQIDKTIFEVLTAEDGKMIALEQIQDINTDDYVMQIKYKETQNYFPSSIREPVIQLMSEFLKTKDKKYYLYCHFKNKAENTKEIDLKELNEILLDKNSFFTEEDKEEFLGKFQLIFACNFDDQFSKVISLLMDAKIASSEDEAIFYYSNIVNYLRDLVVKNKVVGDRVCTKKQIVKYAQDAKRLIFNSAFKEYKGESAYFKFVNSKFTKPNKADENFIVLGDIKEDLSVPVKKLILDLTNSFYKKAMYNIKPITFIVSDKDITTVKKHLIDNEIRFNDGREVIQFSEKLFFESPIINRKPQTNQL